MISLAALAYDAVSRLMRPVAWLILLRRRARGKEDPVRWTERRGLAGAPRPAGALVWLHAASVGESLALLPIVANLRDLGFRVLMTTGTVTSAAMMAQRLPQGALHQYVPLDVPGWVERFLNHWQPDLVVWSESELWPNLIRRTAARGVPMILLNARLSPASARGWRRFGRFGRSLLMAFRAVVAQTPDDAARLRRVAPDLPVRAVANLKHAAPPLPADTAGLAALRRAIGDRPVWLAASTHPGEEDIVADVHAALSATRRDVLTVIAPRHPERGAAIAERLTQRGLVIGRRAAGRPPGADTQVYIADTLGELGLLYRAIPIVFVGKSLVAGGGQNPMEPARLGCAVITGPGMANFADALRLLPNGTARIEVANGSDLGVAVAQLLDDPARLAALSDAARAAAATAGAALQAAWTPVAETVEALRGGRSETAG